MSSVKKYSKISISTFNICRKRDIPNHDFHLDHQLIIYLWLLGNNLALIGLLTISVGPLPWAASQVAYGTSEKVATNNQFRHVSSTKEWKIHWRIKVARQEGTDIGRKLRTVGWTLLPLRLHIYSLEKQVKPLEPSCRRLHYWRSLGC